MTNSFSFNYFGSVITAEPLGIESVPSDHEVITSACVPLTNNNEVIAVNIIGRGVDIPGGHIDPGETSIEAMRRESYEEATIKVGNPVLIDVLKVTSLDKRLGLDHKPYMLIYTARVLELGDFVINDEVSERLVLPQEEFVSLYFADHDYANRMVTSAIQAL
jgi:8-oxo-dGTP diphosphatase